ncbi:single-stranded DNA-binding protein [Bordetella genomosp. 9]|uniref:Single-stranded DNA-binding protein n=1 Tax=Bordetella genomosp. 9 TaxID=1416803 RepID=A0A261RNS3_9BORD|nr:single-stranded DNA-binding protein [Bordetella genomosp. 9]OZI26679.1 single-stranded DNA-binding protein [Bordetella genomosp. 9]
MANDLNRCEFIGRLGRDPETRYGADGGCVVNFSLAVGWKTKDKDGTEWVRIVVFGKLAEICAEYLTKGKQVYVSGRMRTREYEKDGDKRYVTEVVADQMQMLAGKDNDQEREPQQKRSSYADRKSAPQPSQPAKTPEQNLADMDDDIPF